ncbi:MAG: hypothetical protein GTO30_06170 [Acidobacteria bacterium]|nr:hypothetical protein [Acidobacteriota bacterium]NIM61244.1 hypothetical protein [Acidobacteriota bacterium]NIO58049.1 hypothetical protein [Acidobacteriota bacterium]NIQ83588.1 hypothetical protein [Acidobacteriota bacterium]NIT09790.1 hypothetical protein [Acidobacteriota bacterium]
MSVRDIPSAAARRRAPRLATVAAAAVLAASASCHRPAPAIERVVLVGIDGLDWKILRPMIEAGRAPHLARFVAGGASGDLSTLLPTYSPNLWASVATGKVPGKHGIDGFAKRSASDAKKLVPFTSNMRRAKALWNVLGDAGKDVAVVGWWTTWPAEQVRGVMVSDRMQYNRFNIWLGLAHHGQDLPGQTWPRDLFEELVDATVVDEKVEAEFFRRFDPENPEPVLRRDLHDPWYELFLVYGRDRAYAEILDRVLDRGPYDFVAYYLNGPDIASHYFWKYRFPGEWPRPLPEEDVRRHGDVIESYYAWVDDSIAPLLEQADERCLVIVISDHGFVSGARGDSRHISGIHYNTAPDGIIAMAGGGVPAGATLDRAGILDIAPTVLHALGLPVGRDMDGRVLPIFAEGTGASGVELTFVDTHETGDGPTDTEPRDTEHDEVILEKLRALGYI